MLFETTFSKLTSHRLVRLLVMGLAIGSSLWGIWISGRLAFSSILVKYAMSVGSLAAANESLRFSIDDAEAHFARAAVLKASGRVDQAIPEFEHSVALRPRDYYLWLELGIAREENNDPAGALAAFNEAVRLAPYYARPRYQRGNLLIRTRHYDEGFADLRAAAESDPDLIPSLIDLSWGFSQGDVEAAKQLAGITTPRLHLALARYLARQGKAQEALEQFQAAGTVSDETKREFVAQLIGTNAFAAAFQIWRGKGAEDRSAALPVAVYDGGFEGPLSLDEAGFGWRVLRNPKGVALSLDASQPQTGSKSLQIDFTGESNPDTAIVSQLLVVEPAKTYQVTFAARTKDIVSGGLPLVRVTDVSGQGKPLGQSPTLAQGTSDWRTVTLQFITGTATPAVVLSLQRQSCTTAPCPAFGTVWLDSFSLVLVEAKNQANHR